MFSGYRRTRDAVKTAYQGETVPEKVATSMIEFVDYLYEGHVMALNALRVRYITILRASLVGEGIATGDAIAAHSKSAFRAAFFEIADVLMDDFWVKMSAQVITFACESAYAKIIGFPKPFAEANPDFAEILKPINECLPDPVAKANVVEKIVCVVIKAVTTKVMTFLATKMLIWSEKKLFTQAAATTS